MDSNDLLVSVSEDGGQNQVDHYWDLVHGQMALALLLVRLRGRGGSAAHSPHLVLLYGALLLIPGHHTNENDIKIALIKN